MRRSCILDWPRRILPHLLPYKDKFYKTLPITYLPTETTLTHLDFCLACTSAPKLNYDRRGRNNPTHPISDGLLCFPLAAVID